MRLDVMTVIGMGAGFLVIFLAIAVSGSLGLFWSLQSVLITVCGSFTALLINYKFEQIKKVFSTVKQAFTQSESNSMEILNKFSAMAKKARREGLLALESEVDEQADEFFAKGIQMMVDALDPELIREVLETDIEYTRRRHQLGQNIFVSWGDLAPAFGMIGTLIGLIQMLSRLDDPSALGPSMAVALLTTFYGTLLANLIFIPIAGKLSLKSEEEILEKRMILEGIIAIQSGMNPRILEEKLKAFLPPQVKEQAKEEEAPGRGAAADVPG